MFSYQVIQFGQSTKEATQQIKGIADVASVIPADALHQEVLVFAQRVFEYQGYVQNWPDYSLEPIYQGYKLDLTGNPKIGRWIAGQEVLMPSFTVASHPQHVFRLSGGEVFVGSSVEYADDFQSDTIGPFGEPSRARPINLTNESIRKEWGQAILVAQKQEMQRRGLL